MELNLKHGSHMIRYVEVYLYTEGNVVIPRYSTGVYGSVFKKIKVPEDSKGRSMGSFWEYYVIKNKLQGINRKGRSCHNDEGSREPVGQCIVKYLEDGYNCTVPHPMANSSREFCTKLQIGAINEENNIIQDLSEADLANLTTCLPGCSRDELSLRDSPRINSYSMGPNPRMTLSFLFHDGSFDVREEYLVYDISNLIADVGGYMGLLAGQSILGIYYLSTSWLTKMKIWK